MHDDIIILSFVQLWTKNSSVESDKNEDEEFKDSESGQSDEQPLAAVQSDEEKKKKGGKKAKHGITREAAAAAAAALVPDFDSNSVNFQPVSESSNSVASPQDDEDYEYQAEPEPEPTKTVEKKKPGRKAGRGRYPKVRGDIVSLWRHKLEIIKDDVIMLFSLLLRHR